LLGALSGQDIGVPAAAALTGRDVAGAQALLDDLHGMSLLDEAAPGRYHVLDPLKEFAGSLPPASATELEAALIRLLDFYLVTSGSAIAAAFPFDRDRQPVIDRTCSVALSFDDQQAALDWVTTERPNLIAAVRYAAGHGHRDHTWQLAVLLWRHFH